MRLIQCLALIVTVRPAWYFVDGPCTGFQCGLGQSHIATTDNSAIYACTQDAPFFTVKLNVKVLPCIVLFSKGVAVDRTVGFEEFGAKDDFSTGASLSSVSILQEFPALKTITRRTQLFLTAYFVLMAGG